MQGHDPESIFLRASQQIPRISVSDVAAIASLNPWRSMESMVEKYLYQDCAELFALDACNLGLDMTTEEEELKSVIGKLPEEGRGEIEAIQAQIESAEGVGSSSVCASLLQQVSVVLGQQQTTQALSEEERRFVEEKLRSGAQTGEWRLACLLTLCLYNIGGMTCETM